MPVSFREVPKVRNVKYDLSSLKIAKSERKLADMQIYATSENAVAGLDNDYGSNFPFLKQAIQRRNKVSEATRAASQQNFQSIKIKREMEKVEKETMLFLDRPENNDMFEKHTIETDQAWSAIHDKKRKEVDQLVRYFQSVHSGN